MELKSPQTFNVDVLVLGSGGAGLRAAIEARKQGASVLLVSRSRAGVGNNTAISGSGIAAGTGWREPADSPEVHFRDTIVGGGYINDQRLVEVMTRQSGQQILDLENFGVSFKRRGEGFRVTQLAGHTHPRIVAADIGTDLTVPLRDHAKSSGVTFLERVFVSRLITSGDAVAGAVGIDEQGEVYLFNARATILAVGGAGHIYLKNTNAADAIGSGYALAYDLGVPVLDMEFVQFNLFPTDAESLCANEGVVIRNSLDENVLEKHGISDPMKMNRATLSRAVMTEIVEGRSADGATLTLDTTPISGERFEQLRAFFPKTSVEGQRHFSVGLRCHYFMGGVSINEHAETGIDRLYAAGEVCGGAQGANRLGSNALAEIFVFGKIAGEKTAERALAAKTSFAGSDEFSAELERLSRLGAGGKGDVKELQLSLRTTMWNKAGALRDETSLKEALAEIASLKERYHQVSVSSYRELIGVLELRSMLVTAEMVARAALLRTESRGAHFRSDYPDENNREWLKNILISQKNGEMALSTVPIDLSRLAP